MSLAPTDIQTLQTHAARTGVGAIALMRHLKPRPAGLTSDMVQSWLNGRAKSARAAHWLAVMTAYEALPDGAPARPGKPLAKAAGRRAITDTEREAIRLLSQQVTLTRLLERPDCPPGLSLLQIAHIVSGRNKTAEIAVLDFLISAHTASIHQ